MSQNFNHIKWLVRDLLGAIGENPMREGLVDTPTRVAKMWAELASGYDATPDLKTFDEKSDQLVLLRGVEFHSLCEHHLLPFTGVAHVGYIPQGRVLGLSKIPRLIEVYARRLQVQERLTAQIADAIESACDPLGVAVVLEARHLCVAMRGIQKQGSDFVTSAMRGCFLNQPDARAEFFALIAQGQR